MANKIKFYCPQCKVYQPLIGELIPFEEELELHCMNCKEATVIVRAYRRSPYRHLLYTLAKIVAPDSGLYAVLSGYAGDEWDMAVRAAWPEARNDLRAMRETSGFTQSELAKLAGISRNYLSQLENDKDKQGTMALNIAVRLARALGVGIDGLFLAPRVDPSLIDGAEKNTRG